MTINTAPLNLLALTPCCVDYYPQISKSFMGGNSLNVAALWRKLDPTSSTSVITCLGNDEDRNRIFDFFIKKGIDTTRVYSREGQTATNRLRVDGAGERFGIEGAWQGGVYESFILSEDDWNWVALQDIVAMPANNPNFSNMIRRKHLNQLLSVDYLDIENNIYMAETVAFTDIAFISASCNLLHYYEELSATTNRLIVVTLGANGSYAFFKGKTYIQQAIPIPAVIDTTGCGDAYQAAFALTYYRTRDIQKSMCEGALAASKIAQTWGGVGSDD